MVDSPQMDKKRRAQYRTHVTESFPERMLILGYDKDAEDSITNMLASISALKFVSADARPITFRFDKKQSCRYGMNPGSPAAFYVEVGADGPNMSSYELLQEGRGLGFINIGDMDLGQQVAKKLYDVFVPVYGKPVCAVIKHEMPSGVAIGDNARDAFEKAWNCDSLSAFGSVDVFTSEVDEDVAKLLAEPPRNVEVVYAPSFTPAALDALKSRKEMRVVKMKDIALPVVDSKLNIKAVAGGLLMEKRYDSKIISPDCTDCVSDRKPTAEEVQAAIFQWLVAGYTRSNAVVIGTQDKTHGIGSGQRSRIHSALNAVYMANNQYGLGAPGSYGARGTVMASDAFMPATDVVELAAREGITAIIYPLGSVKDKDVIDVANKNGISMIITRTPGETQGGERCFTHR